MRTIVIALLVVGGCSTMPLPLEKASPAYECDWNFISPDDINQSTVTQSLATCDAHVMTVSDGLIDITGNVDGSYTVRSSTLPPCQAHALNNDYGSFYFGGWQLYMKACGVTGTFTAIPLS